MSSTKRSPRFRRHQPPAWLCLAFISIFFCLPAFGEEGVEAAPAASAPTKGASSITLENNDSIFFKDSAGVLDGTEIRRYSNNRLRFRYKKAPLIFDALDGQMFQIRDAAGSIRLFADPTPTSTSALFEVRDDVYPSISVKAITAQSTDIGQLAIATSPGFYSAIADPSDVVLRALGEDLILEAGRTGGGIRMATQGVEKMTVLSNGNVGIGDNNPSEKLEVNGNIKLSGSIVADGDICIGSGC